MRLLIFDKHSNIQNVRSCWSRVFLASPEDKYEHRLDIEMAVLSLLFFLLQSFFTQNWVWYYTIRIAANTASVTRWFCAHCTQLASRWMREQPCEMWRLKSTKKWLAEETKNVDFLVWLNKKILSPASSPSRLRLSDRTASSTFPPIKFTSYHDSKMQSVL